MPNNTPTESRTTSWAGLSDRSSSEVSTLTGESDDLIPAGLRAAFPAAFPRAFPSLSVMLPDSQIGSGVPYRSSESPSPQTSIGPAGEETNWADQVGVYRPTSARAAVKTSTAS